MMSHQSQAGTVILSLEACRLYGEPTLGGFRRLDEVLLASSLIRNEQAAVRAFEAAMPLVPASQELTFELLLAVGTDDLVRGWGGGHPDDGSSGS